jgi:hypothetical protein
LTVLAAIGAASMLGSLQQTKAALAVTAALVVLACFEGYGPIPIAEVGPRGYTRDFGLYEWLRNQPPGAVVELPIGRLDGHYRGFVYEYNTLVHQHPVVNGWTGYTTDLQQFLGSDASPLRHRDQLSDGLDLLRGLHVRYLIVHPDDFDPRDNAAPILNGLIADPSRWTAMKQFGAAFVFTLPAEADAPRGPPLDRLAPATIRVNVSHSPDRLPFLFDGDIDTRWTTGAAQDGSEWIELRFDRTVDVRRLRFEVQPRNFRDYPRILEVAAIDGGGAVPLFQGSVLMAFGRGLRLNQMRVPIDVDLPSHPTRAIRIAQKGRVDGIWWWSIDELTVMVVGH